MLLSVETGFAKAGGGVRADNLRLWERNAGYLGGWCEQAVVDQIVTILKESKR